VTELMSWICDGGSQDSMALDAFPDRAGGLHPPQLTPGCLVSSFPALNSWEASSSCIEKRLIALTSMD
jgi:hypothetical protein